MSRRRRKKNPIVPIIIISIVLVSLIMSGAGIAFKDFFIMILIIGFSVLGILVFILIWNLPVNKGKRGEKRVGKILEQLAEKYNGYVINDIIIPNGNGGTSQIDHILLSRFGIVVVETKNYSGRLYGTPSQQYWTQVLAYGNTKNKLYNPLLQNKTHIYNLKQIVGNKIDFYSCIVILRANLDYLEITDEIFTLRELKDSLNEEIKKDNYDDEIIRIAYEKLIDYKNNPIATTKEHVKNIKETQKKIEHNICPRCGGKLILRTSKNGSHFYGCENYPKCKFTKQI